MQTNFETLTLSDASEKVLLVTLNRPEVRNALNTQMMQDLHDLWQELTKDQQGYRCVIVTGAGEKAFCAGADLKERNGMSVETWQKQHALLEKMIVLMLDCPLPIIAAVNGHAFGGGLELLLACDFAFAVEQAKFGFPESKLGIIPGAMGTQQLPRAVGIRKAKQICMSCEPFTAKQGHEWGLLNELVAADMLMSRSLAVAQTIALQAPLAVQAVKHALNASEDYGLHQGYEHELTAYNSLLDTKDRYEGVAAFNEKRQPKLEGK